MSRFASLRDELVAEVFDLWGTDATRTGYPLPFQCVLRASAAEANGVAYEVMTARIYKSDAVLALGEVLTADAQNWEIDGVLARDALTNTYTLRAT